MAEVPIAVVVASRTMCNLAGALTRVARLVAFLCALTAGAGPAPAASVAIAYFGDSTIEGVDPRDLDQRCPTPAPRAAEIYLDRLYGPGAVAVVNRGKGGSRSDLFLQREGDWSVALAQSGAPIVAFNWGVNDAFDARVTPAIYESNLRRLVAGARAAGKIAVIETPNPLVQGVRPFGVIAAPEKEQAIVAAARRVAEDTRSPLIDQHAFLQTLPDWRQRIPDGAHPDCDLYIVKGRFAAGVFASVIDALGGATP